MKFNRIKYLLGSMVIIFTLLACNNDDSEMMEDDDMTVMSTCDDGLMNADETGIDCGGSCGPCEIISMDPDFSGTYAQVDYMGRPGINTVLSTSGVKDTHNQSIPSTMGAILQPGFETQLEAYHDAYAIALGLTAEDVDYEPNILTAFVGFDVTAEILTTVLASDVLEVAPNAQTTYFNGSVPIGLTGRTLQDDVIDISLILLFGGNDGARFNGDGGLPLLVSDGVGLTADNITTTFPYIGAPE